jgi:hypothetical protein
MSSLSTLSVCGRIRSHNTQNIIVANVATFLIRQRWEHSRLGGPKQFCGCKMGTDEQVAEEIHERKAAVKHTVPTPNFITFADSGTSLVVPSVRNGSRRIPSWYPDIKVAGPG